MNPTSFKDISLDDLVDELKSELIANSIESHISWVTSPALPLVKHAYTSGGHWLEFLDFITDCFSVVCLYRYVEGILYIAIMLDQNQKEAE